MEESRKIQLVNGNPYSQFEQKLTNDMAKKGSKDKQQ